MTTTPISGEGRLDRIVAESRPDLLPRIASVLTWIYGYAEALTKSDDPKIAKIGDDLLAALYEGKS